PRTPRAQTYPLSLHDALPIYRRIALLCEHRRCGAKEEKIGVQIGHLKRVGCAAKTVSNKNRRGGEEKFDLSPPRTNRREVRVISDRKSTRLNSSHVKISYAVF